MTDTLWKSPSDIKRVPDSYAEQRLAHQRSYLRDYMRKYMRKKRAEKRASVHSELDDREVSLGSASAEADLPHIVPPTDRPASDG